MSFLRGIYSTFLSNVSLELNLAPIFLLYDANSDVYSLLYASTNYLYFDTAQTVSSDQLRSVLFAKLAGISIPDLINTARTELSTKYSLFHLHLLGVQFNVLKTPNIVYGGLGYTSCCQC